MYEMLVRTSWGTNSSIHYKEQLLHCCFGVPSGLIVRFVRNEHMHSVANTQSF